MEKLGVFAEVIEQKECLYVSEHKSRRNYLWILDMQKKKTKKKRYRAVGPSSSCSSASKHQQTTVALNISVHFMLVSAILGIKIYKYEG